jgi:hypothetical protein
VILEEALSRIRKIYGVEVFKEGSAVHSSPNFRPKRDNELKVNYTWASMGITGARKPIWKGFARKDGKPVKIIGYALDFCFDEDSLSLICGQPYRPKLTDESFKKFFEFLRHNSRLVHAIQNLSEMRYPSLSFDEEEKVIVPFDQFIDMLIDLKDYAWGFYREIRLPIGLADLTTIIDSFVIFYPIYDSALRIAKGEKDIFEELTSKLKRKHLFSEDEDNLEDEDADEERPERLVTEEEKDLLAKSVDGKKIVKAGMRWQVMERDDFKCVACGLSAKDGAILHVDHIVPRSKGGLDVMENYQTLCHQCNIGKSNKSQINLRRE